jgi:hypothetical protein
MTSILVYLKPYWLHITVLISVLLNLWLLTRPTPTPTEVTKTEYVDRVVEKEVVKVVNRDIIKHVNRDIVRTITKPGVQIVEQIKESEGQRDRSTEVGQTKIVDKELRKSESMVKVASPPRYLLGVGITPSGGFASANLGVRVHPSLPVYLGAGVAKHGTVYGLTLNVGVAL